MKEYRGKFRARQSRGGMPSTTRFADQARPPHRPSRANSPTPSYPGRNMPKFVPFSFPAPQKAIFTSSTSSPPLWNASPTTLPYTATRGARFIPRAQR
ncbi:hypothetical protein BJV78DRAFT_634651 [Lactifluus subvellereus]|nr:hypothetical protein BJV78DRAFT_634651 [Lactifluus subvellereus]